MSPGRFGKSRLDLRDPGRVRGRADLRHDHQSAKHAFTYFDDVRRREVASLHRLRGTHVGDDLDSGHQINRASALGMSETNAGDGHIYLGFNPGSPDQDRLVRRLPSRSTAASTESLVEFIDINGDTLARQGVPARADALKYRLNTSRPSDGAGRMRWTFSATQGTIAGPRQAPGRDSSSGSTGGSRRTSASSASSTSAALDFADGYFTDANADGLPDFVLGGVLFNHLDCSGNSGRLDDPNLCIPSFSEQHTSTRVPLDVVPGGRRRR